MTSATDGLWATMLNNSEDGLWATMLNGRPVGNHVPTTVSNHAQTKWSIMLKEAVGTLVEAGCGHPRSICCGLGPWAPLFMRAVGAPHFAVGSGPPGSCRQWAPWFVRAAGTLVQFAVCSLGLWLTMLKNRGQACSISVLIHVPTLCP